MPKVANGIDLDYDIARPLAFVNHANMGSYRAAIDAYLSGRDSVPDVTAHRTQGRLKYGAGLNVEQELTSTLRGFARFGWNDGHNESFAYTEIDQTVAGGVDVRGHGWRRKDDRVGVACVSNALSADHREYLQLGGTGFLLGDGSLGYGREAIAETYYTAKLWGDVHASFDLQRVFNPGYNRARGPILVGAVRLHFEAALFPR